MYILYFFLALFSWGFYYKLNKDILHPCGIFLFFWFFTSFISNLELSTAIPPWSTQLHFVVILSGFSLFIGSLIFITSKKKTIFEKKPCNYFYRFLTSLLFLFSLVCFIIEWKVNDFQLALFTPRSSDLKANIIAIPFIHYGTIFLPFLSIYLFFQEINTLKTSFFAVIKLLFIILIYSLCFGISRGDLLLYLFSFLFIYTRYYKLKIKSVIILLALFLSIVVGVIIYRVPSSSIVYSMTENPYVSIFYSYIATCFANLDVLIQSDDPFHFLGNGTFQFFWTLIGQKDAFPITNYDSMGVFNATTYLYPFYHDYKIIGIIIFPFLMGSFYSLLYRATFKNTNWILLLSMVQKTIIFSFFGNYLFGELTLLFPFLITIIFIMVISKYNLKKIHFK